MMSKVVSAASSGLRQRAFKAFDRNVLTMGNFSWSEVNDIVTSAKDIKAFPAKYHDALEHKSLVMLFEKPSLRTRLSFEIGMTQLGGHAIFYSLDDSPLGEKETIEDTSRVMSGYADAIIARLNCRFTLRSLADNSSVPVINALDDYGHPCQILADLLTLSEHVGDLSNIKKIAYLGDAANNVTYDLCRAAALGNINISIATPKDPTFEIEPEVLQECEAIGNGRIDIGHDPFEAASGADAVITDTWSSYHLSASEKPKRISLLEPFRVTEAVMSVARPDAVFMHCMPAERGMEVDADVFDGRQSVVLDQANNRLHAQKALLLHLLSPE